MAQTFESLFQGSELGHGEWDASKQDPYKAKTHRGKAPLQAYENHLAGKLGLGLVPIKQDGTCTFAAIDIDVDDINHVELARQVETLGIPLHVCRSKSGGAHLYWFSQEPVPAAKVQQLLKGWAAALGHAKAEIFPKQGKVDPASNVGNWINLPYFANERTTRYCVRSSGSISLEEFLSSITFYDPKKHRPIRFNTENMPPCLTSICGDGVKAGGRNEVLFNLAIFYRKSTPEGWEARSREANSQFDTPLDVRETEGIIQSLTRTRYNYTCEKSPLKDFCDRKSCEKLKFGIKHQMWQEGGVFPEPKYAHLRKITSTPPRYVLRVDDLDVDFQPEELTEFKAFKRKIFTATNQVIATMKQGMWDMVLQELIKGVVEIAAPEDASVEGLVMNRVDEFLALHTRSRNEEDLIKQHIPVVVNGHVVFRGMDLQTHLKAMKIDRLEMNDVYRMLAKRGVEHKTIVVKGKSLVVWAVPREQLHEQTEEFTAPEFKEDEREM